jgi:ribose transport system permease protein
VSANIEKQTEAKEVSVWDKLVRISLKEAGVAIALILILAFFSATAPYFATPENFLKIFVQIAINTVLAAGMTFVILVGGIDLSVGSLLALCTVIGATIMINPAFSPWQAIVLACLASMGTGAILGAVNGWICEKWKLPSFIVTLGMLNVASGLARVVSDNSTIGLNPGNEP